MLSQMTGSPSFLRLINILECVCVCVCVCVVKYIATFSLSIHQQTFGNVN